MLPFQYNPLDPTQRSIRLLRIKSGQFSDDIVCWLFEADLDREQGATYQALSYTWGSTQHSKTEPEKSSFVIINNIQFNDVSQNLLLALRQIRQRDEDVILWVDAICINQKDNEERSHQVGQMGYVYGAAEEVIIWLGPSNKEIQSLMDSIRWIDRKATEAQALRSNQDWNSLCHLYARELAGDFQYEVHSKRKQALKELLNRRWFNRVWVLQEVAKARNARVMCGSSSCPARTFALMPSLLGLEMLSDHTQAVLDIMPRLRHNTWWASENDLHFLLQKFAKSESEEPKDKVYALLGMSKDAYNPKRFYPCYKKSDAQVFRDTACFLIFGEILDSSYSFPEFTLEDLHRPITLLVQKSLQWALSYKEDSPNSMDETVRVLVNRMNEGQIKIPDCLLPLAEEQGQYKEVDQLFIRGDVTIDVIFENKQSLLKLTSRNASTESVILTFPRLQAWKQKPFDEDKDMSDVIDQLIESGSPKEDILRAQVWAGNKHAVQKAIDEGVSIDAIDTHGRAAVHYAAWQGYPEIMKLLIQAGVNIDMQDDFRMTALQYAANGAQH